MSRRVIVCGGRDFADAKLLDDTLRDLLKPGDVVVQGGARGADRMARAWCELYGYSCVEFYADWDRYGKRAGPIRNIAMLNSGAALVIAFPGGRGTAHMVGIAKKKAVPVVEVR